MFITFLHGQFGDWLKPVMCCVYKLRNCFTRVIGKKGVNVMYSNLKLYSFPCSMYVKSRPHNLILRLGSSKFDFNL